MRLEYAYQVVTRKCDFWTAKRGEINKINDIFLYTYGLEQAKCNHKQKTEEI